MRSTINIYAFLAPPKVIGVAKKIRGGYKFKLAGVDAFMACLIKDYMNATVYLKSIKFQEFANSDQKTGYIEMISKI